MKFRKNRTKRMRGKATRYDRSQDRVIKKMREVLTPELKVLQNHGGSAAMTTTGSIQCATSLTQGNGQGQRVGMEQRNKHAYTRLYFSNTAVNGPNYARIIYFTWNQNTVPVATDIMEFDDIRSGYNRLPDRKYVVKKDVLVQLAANLTPWSEPYYKYVEVHIPLSGVCKYNGTTNLGVDAGSGHLWSIAYASSVAVTLGDSYSYTYTDA